MIAPCSVVRNIRVLSDSSLTGRFVWQKDSHADFIPA